MSSRQHSNSSEFSQTIEQHKGILYKIARMYCPDEEDRQDLMQEMMIQIWKALPGYNQSAAVSTWLYRICLNVAISHYRKEKTKTRRMIEVDDYMQRTHDTEAVYREEQFQRLEQLIGELKEIDKAIMILYLESRPQAEIAGILGISANNVSTRVSRIKERLRQRFLSPYSD